jgi:hypothetical protein
MQYVIVILFIFGLQIYVFSSFEALQRGSPFEQKRIGLLKRENEGLRVQLASVEEQAQRGVASIRGAQGKKNIDLGQFYLSQYESSLAAKDARTALQHLQKIRDVSIDENVVPLSVYKKIVLKCERVLEKSCLDDVEFLVEQFPESEWTGKSMLWLSDYYTRVKKAKEAQVLREIVAREFGTRVQR